MKEKLLRGIFIVGLTLNACSEVRPVAKLPQPIPITLSELDGCTVEVKEWKTVEIPANDQACLIKNISEVMSEDIGLKELYLVNSKLYPVAFIVAKWDVENVRSGAQGAQNISGALGLQSKTEEFKPANVTANQRQLSLDISEDMIQRAWLRALPSLRNYIQGRGQDISASIRDRPKDASVIVFGSGAIEYHGQPSPLSFIKLSFKFQEPHIPAPRLPNEV